jgi:nitrogen fixation/metabolism regulation signal transduction histidine kinase
MNSIPESFIYSKAAEDLNINFTIYRQNSLEYSTNDLIYDVGLLPKIINPYVYQELMLQGSQETIVEESVDGYKFNSFYYKANFGESPIVIKVNDAFNNILLPLSGSEVDIFLFGFYSLAVILIIIFSAIFANQISMPIRKITMATKSVAAGDLSLELKTDAKGELGDLVAGFQYMIKELKKNQSMLAEIEREEAWKEMAKQVAHEIKNPLTPMKLSVQQLITAYNDGTEKFESLFKKVTSTILNQIETLKNIATEFSNFARMPKLRLEQIDCVEILKQSIDLFTEEEVKIISDFSTNSVLIKGDSEQLRRTFINLIRNSIQADSTLIKFEIVENSDSFELYLIDNGKGVSKENLSKIFEPNFTTKKEGMGLGLSMAKRYLRSSGGDISIHRSSEEGTVIKIILLKV